jgi:hypothetical protein
MEKTMTKKRGRPPTKIAERLDDLLNYLGAGGESQQTDGEFGVVLGISKRQAERVIALGRRLGKLSVEKPSRVYLGRGWHNVRTLRVIADMPYRNEEWDRMMAEPVVEFPVASNVQNIIHYALRDLRQSGQHSEERAAWIRDRDIPALVREVAAGSPITKDILVQAVCSLKERAIAANHPRQQEIDRVRRYIRSHLWETHGDVEGDKLHAVIVRAKASHDLVLAIDGVQGDRTQFSREAEAARDVIRSVIPEWKPAAIEGLA